MDPAIEIERFAALSAEIDAGATRDEICAREGLSAEQWAAAQETWLARLADETGRKRFELTNRYNSAFVAKRRELAHGPRAFSARRPAVKAAAIAAPSPVADLPPPPPVAIAAPPEAVRRAMEAPFVPEAPRAPVVVEPPPPQVVAPAPAMHLEMPTIVGTVMSPLADATPFTMGPRATPNPGPAEPGPVFAGAPRAEPGPAATAPPKAPTPPPARPAIPRANFGKTIADDVLLPPTASPLPFQRSGASGEKRDEPARAPIADRALPFQSAPKVEATPPRSPSLAATTAAPPMPPPRAKDASKTGPLVQFADPFPFAATPGETKVRDIDSDTTPPGPAPRLGATGALPFQPSAAPAPAARQQSTGGLPFQAPATSSTPDAATKNPTPPPARPGPPRPSPSPPRPTPSPSSGPVAMGPQAAPNPGPATPGPAPSERTPGRARDVRFTVEQFASLAAEIAVNPAATAQIRARYGLDEATHRAEAKEYSRRFAADPALYTRYTELFEAYREWLSTGAR